MGSLIIYHMATLNAFSQIARHEDSSSHLRVIGEGLREMESNYIYSFMDEWMGGWLFESCILAQVSAQ